MLNWVGFGLAEEGAAEAPVNAMVFLHGLGGNHQEAATYLRYLLQSCHNVPGNTIFICPEAPISTGYGDGRAWYFQIKDDLVKTDLLLSSLAKLKEFIATLPFLVDAPLGSVCLSGFSQGGTMSVAYPLVYPDHAIDYFGCFSGYVPLNLPLGTPSLLGYGNILWGHGTEDYENPYYLATAGIQTLKSLGVVPTHVHNPVGHMVHPSWMEQLFSLWRPGNA